MRRQFDRLALLILLFFAGLIRPVLAQQTCAGPLLFTPVSQPNRIEWSKFPDFSLPFTVIYAGPRFGDTSGQPLRHGFSHLGTVTNGELVPPRQRTVIYYGVAYGLNQPWETLESPWANDLTAYRAKWDRWLSDLAGGQRNVSGKYVVQVSRITLDVERIAETDVQILRLKTNNTVPAQYRSLSDAGFISAYKRDLRNLYAEAAGYIRQHTDLSNVVISGYADTPILNTYLNVPTFSWADWTTNLNRVNYLVKDSTESRVGGPYYDQLDALSPSAYYYYDYPSPLAKDYLAYLLFQVEANRAWSNKPVVPFVWLRYHNTSNTPFQFIQPFMAEATAIFPFFSGAAGLHLWEDPTLQASRTDNQAAYEYFTHGLYRLSRFADQFQGPHELVIETPARDLMDKQLPVWRGVVKNNTILIAAQNPYADENSKTELVVRYKTNWQRTIELTGREVFLCRFDIGAVTAAEPVVSPVQVYPNPTTSQLIVSLGQTPAADTELTLQDMVGRIVLRQPIKTELATLNVAGLPAGLYLLRIRTPTGNQIKKIVIH